MLKKEWTRDLAGTYLLLTDPDAKAEDSFDLKILSANRIPGLLPLSADRINGSVSCRLDITGLVPFDLYWEHSSGSMDSVRAFFLDLIDHLLLFEDYLLDTSRLLFAPDCLYMQPDTHSLMIAYCPFCSSDLRGSLVELTEHLLLLIGHRDRDGIILTCRVLHELRSPATELAALKALLLHDEGRTAVRSLSEDAENQPDGFAAPLRSSYVYDALSRGDEQTAADARSRRTSGFEMKKMSAAGSGSQKRLFDTEAGEHKRLSDMKRGRDGRTSAPEKGRSRAAISTTAAAEIRPEAGTLRMMLFALIPSAAIYVLLHVQTMFFLNTEEMIAAALLVCAAVLAILTAIRPGGKRKTDRGSNSQSKRYSSDEEHPTRGDPDTRDDCFTARNEPFTKCDGREFDAEYGTAAFPQGVNGGGTSENGSFGNEWNSYTDDENRKRRAKRGAYDDAGNGESSERRWFYETARSTQPCQGCYDHTESEQTGTVRDLYEKSLYPGEAMSLYDSLSSCPERMPYLCPDEAGSPFPEITLSDQEIIIGSSGKPGTCFLSDHSVSRVHARILENDGIWYVEDLNSKNGTFVNGRLLAPNAQIPLTEGARVSFGDCRYVFRV